MKKLAYLLIAVLVIVSGNDALSQKKKKGDEPVDKAPVQMDKGNGGDVSNDVKVYNMAMENRDYSIALNATYRILAKDPTQENYKDTMAVLYYYLFDYVKCLKITDEILAKEPGKSTLFEMKAICLKALGNVAESLKMYEEIYKENANIIYKYQIAELQYNLKRYGECQATIMEIVNTTDIDSTTIRISINARQYQNVPIKAAAFNVHGMASLDFKETEGAKKSFQKAIELYPDFFLAKQNLVSMEEKNKNAGGK